MFIGAWYGLKPVYRTYEAMLDSSSQVFKARSLRHDNQIYAMSALLANEGMVKMMSESAGHVGASLYHIANMIAAKYFVQCGPHFDPFEPSLDDFAFNEEEEEEETADQRKMRELIEKAMLFCFQGVAIRRKVVGATPDPRSIEALVAQYRQGYARLTDCIALLVNQIHILYNTCHRYLITLDSKELSKNEKDAYERWADYDISRAFLEFALTLIQTLICKLIDNPMLIEEIPMITNS
jgi:hypothetical protein